MRTGGADGEAGLGSHFAMLALGTKGGKVWLWRYRLPRQYPPAATSGSVSFQLVHFCLLSTPLAHSQMPKVALDDVKGLQAHLMSVVDA